MRAWTRQVRWLSMMDRVLLDRKELKPNKIQPATFEVARSLGDWGEEITQPTVAFNSLMLSAISYFLSDILPQLTQRASRFNDRICPFRY